MSCPTVQPGAPKGNQNTGRSVDLSSAGAGSTLYGKTTMEQSYTSYKTGGTGGGIPEQRSSHITTTHTSRPSDAAQGSGMGSGYSSLSSKADDSSAMQGSGMGQGLGGTSRSGISQGSGAAAGGSGMKSTLAHGSGSGSGSGSGFQAHQLSTDRGQGYNRSGMKDTIHGSGVTHAYERAGLGETGQKAGLGDYTISGVRPGGMDTSHHTSGMMGSSGLRETAGTSRSTGFDNASGTNTVRGYNLSSTTKPSGLQKSYDQTSGMMGSTRDSGLKDSTHSHIGGSTIKSSDLGQSSGAMDTTRGSGLTDNSQGLKKSGIGSTAIKPSGPDSSYHQSSGMTGSTRDTTLRDTTHGQSKHSGLAGSTTTSKPSGTSKTHRGSDMTGKSHDSTTRDFGAQGYGKPDMQGATTTKTFEDDLANRGSGVTSTSRDLGRSQGYDKISTGQTAMGDKARSSGLKDTTTSSTHQTGYQGSDMTSGTHDSRYHGAGMTGATGATGATGLAQGYDRSGTTDMSSTTRDIKPTSGYNKSSSQMPESGDLSRKSGMRDAAKSSGPTYGNRGSGMTDAARSAGTSGMSSADTEHIAVSDIAKKAGLGAAATGLAAGAGSAIAGKSTGSGMKQGYQKSGAGQTSSTDDIDAKRSGIVEPTPSRSDLDSGYQGSRNQGSGGTADREMGQKSTLGETNTRGTDTGYQGAGMAGTTRDSNVAQGSQGYNAGVMGQKSTHGGTTGVESMGAGSGYQNVGTTGTTGDSSLSQGYSRSGMGETDQKNLGELDTSGLGQKSQDADVKDTTSGSPSGRKPSLIQKAKKKIGLGSSDEKSSTTGDTAKSGLDEGYEKSGLKDQPGVDQAYQKAGLGDKAKSGIDGRYRGQGVGTQETTDVSPTSRDMPQSGLGKTSQEYGRSGHGTAEGVGLAGAGVAGAGAGLAGTSKSTTSQGYQSSGMRDTSRDAGITDTSRSGTGQTYQSSGTGIADSTTRTMPGSYDSYGTMDTSQGTGLTDTSRSGEGYGYKSSGIRDTTTSGMGQGHQTTGTGLSRSTHSGAGHTYDTSGTKGSSEGVGLADTTKSGLNREHQSPEIVVPAIGGSMGSTITEEEEPASREIRGLCPRLVLQAISN